MESNPKPFIKRKNYQKIIITNFCKAKEIIMKGLEEWIYDEIYCSCNDEIFDPVT